MIIDDNWFTRSMLLKTIAQNEKMTSQIEKNTSGNENPFFTILNQFIKQQESNKLEQLNSNFIPHENVLRNNLYQANTPIMNNGYINYKSNERLSYQPTGAENINQVLGGKLTGMGETFVRAGQQYNIDPALLTAIAQHETGNGKSRAAIEKNNIAGMMGRNGLKAYSNVEESIMDMARNLSKNYLGEGLSSISEIGAKYAPVGVSNDPTGLNNHWVTGVSKLFNHIRV